MHGQGLGKIHGIGVKKGQFEAEKQERMSSDCKQVVYTLSKSRREGSRCMFHIELILNEQRVMQAFLCSGNDGLRLDAMCFTIYLLYLPRSLDPKSNCSESTIDMYRGTTIHLVHDQEQSSRFALRRCSLGRS